MPGERCGVPRHELENPIEENLSREVPTMIHRDTFRKHHGCPARHKGAGLRHGKDIPAQGVDRPPIQRRKNRSSDSAQQTLRFLGLRHALRGADSGNFASHASGPAQCRITLTRSCAKFREGTEILGCQNLGFDKVMSCLVAQLGKDSLCANGVELHTGQLGPVDSRTSARGKPHGRRNDDLRFVRHG